MDNLERAYNGNGQDWAHNTRIGKRVAPYDENIGIQRFTETGQETSHSKRGETELVEG